MHWIEPSENGNSDARSSEQEIRQKLIESRAVDVMVAVGANCRADRRPDIKCLAR